MKQTLVTASVLSALSLTLLVAPALALDMPPIKAGLWSVDVTVDGKSEGVMKQCVDSKTAEQLLTAGQKMLAGSCTDVEMSREGGSYVSSIDCNLGVSKMKAVTTMEGDFGKKYTSETKTTFNPPMMGRDTMVSKSVGTYVGDCEAGMKPGDTIMADGRRMNVLDMMKDMPKMNQLQDMQKNMEASGVDLEELQKQMPNLEELQKAMQQQGAQ